MRNVAATRRRAGYTLIEVAIALSVFLVLGYSLMVTVDVGYQSNQTVQSVASGNRAMRKATDSFAHELRMTSAATLNIVVLPDANHQVTFQMPIDVGGVMSWGVFDRTLGMDPAAWTQDGWFLRYTVLDLPDSDGGLTKTLVRQVLDTKGAVQRQTDLAHDVRLGTANPPGFQVIPAGDLWEVQFTTDGDVGNNTAKHAVFHVELRN